MVPYHTRSEPAESKLTWTIPCPLFSPFTRFDPSIIVVMLGVPNGFVAFCFTCCVTAFQTVSVSPRWPRHHRGRRGRFATLDLSATMLNIDQGVPRDIGTMDEWATYYGV